MANDKMRHKELEETIKRLKVDIKQKEVVKGYVEKEIKSARTELKYLCVVADKYGIDVKSL